MRICEEISLPVEDAELPPVDILDLPDDFFWNDFNFCFLCETTVSEKKAEKVEVLTHRCCDTLWMENDATERKPLEPRDFQFNMNELVEQFEFENPVRI
jgi:hypothetical protein